MWAMPLIPRPWKPEKSGFQLSHMSLALHAGTQCDRVHLRGRRPRRVYVGLFVLCSGREKRGCWRIQTQKREHLGIVGFGMGFLLNRLATPLTLQVITRRLEEEEKKTLLNSDISETVSVFRGTRKIKWKSSVIGFQS